MLNPMMMNVIMRTILKTDRNSFEDNIIKLKPKSEYRNDVFSNVIAFIFSAVCSYSVKADGTILSRTFTLELSSL